MDNYQIADVFSLLGKIMDIHGENSFKTRSYSSAAFQIEKLPEQLSSMQTQEIAAQKGIGAAIAQKITELLQTGKLSLLEKYIQTTPPGVIEMLNIKGIGPKKINTIWKEMGIESIGELQYACNENRLTMYKGFGEKTQQNVNEAITFYLNQQGLFLFQQVELVANEILRFLQLQIPTAKTIITGAFRRQIEVLEEIVLLSTASSSEIISAVALLSHTTLQATTENKLTYAIESGPTLEIQLTNSENWAVDLFTTTGSTEFVAAIQSLIPADKQFQTEEEIFAFVQLPFIAPCMRENPETIQRISTEGHPVLIEATDIRGIIHSHSKWSDGSDSIEEMAMAAKQKGLEYLVISDHSKSAGYANGLSEERIRQQHVEIDKLNASLAPFRIFKSIECDILGDGSLDYDDEVLASFDLVIASVHSNLKMTEEKAMQRLLTAIANPYVTILGHMTGRLLLSRHGYPLNHQQIIDACIDQYVVIELNAHPRRLDIDWRWISYATDKGGLISINPDAHAVDGFSDTRYGVLVAQKGGLTKAQNLSSFSLKAFEDFIIQNRMAKGLIG